MPDVAIAARAREDLRDIFLYGLSNFGLKQAQRYADDVDTVFLLLASQPRMGRPARSLGGNVRRHEHHAHVIFYEEVRDGVTILAVVHAGAANRVDL